jgi:hypothetical protein
MATQAKTLSIPEAGAKYFGLSKNGSYDAAARGEIPFIEIGRLKRVPVVAMERLMEECGRPAPASRRLTHRTAKIARGATA